MDEVFHRLQHLAAPSIDLSGYCQQQHEQKSSAVYLSAVASFPAIFCGRACCLDAALL